MKRAVLAFPSPRFRLEAPEEVLAELGKVYPESLRTAASESAGRPVRATFRIERHGAGYRLREGDGGARRGRTVGQVARLVGLRVEELLLEGRGERVAMHAGAVAVDGGACLVAGRPGAGKTACTFQLVEMGYEFLAEEVALIDARGRVEPFPQALALSTGLLAEHDRWFRRRSGGVSPAAPGLVWYRPQRCARRPVPLRTILLPRFDRTATARLRRRPTGQALVEVLGHCFAPVGDEETHFEEVMRLVDGARIFALDYADVRQARALLAEALARGWR